MSSKISHPNFSHHGEPINNYGDPIITIAATAATIVKLLSFVIYDACRRYSTVILFQRRPSPRQSSRNFLLLCFATSFIIGPVDANNRTKDGVSVTQCGRAPPWPPPRAAPPFLSRYHDELSWCASVKYFHTATKDAIDYQLTHRVINSPSEKFSRGVTRLDLEHLFEWQLHQQPTTRLDLEHLFKWHLRRQLSMLSQPCPTRVPRKPCITHRLRKARSALMQATDQNHPHARRVQSAYWDPNQTQVESHRLILSQDTSFVISQRFPSFATMTTRPSRKSPSSLLSATMASSARTRSSSRLAKARGDTMSATSAEGADPSPVAVVANAPKDKPRLDTSSLKGFMPVDVVAGTVAPHGSDKANNAPPPRRCRCRERGQHSWRRP